MFYSQQCSSLIETQTNNKTENSRTEKFIQILVNNRNAESTRIHTRKNMHKQKACSSMANMQCCCFLCRIIEEL